MNEKNEIPSFYKASPKRKIKSRALIYVLLVFLATTVILFFIFMSPKSSHEESLIGKIVKISGKDNFVGLVEKFEKGDSIVLRPIYENNDKLIFFSLQENSITIIAENIDEFKKLFPYQTTLTEKEQTNDSKEKIEGNDVSIESSISDRYVTDINEIAQPMEEKKETNYNRSVSEGTKGFFAEKRESCLQELDELMKALSLKADELDIQWRRYRDACKEKYTSMFVDGRDWFGVYTSNVTVPNETTPYCRELMSDVVRLAEEIRKGMIAIIIKARHDGLFPGDVRKVRKKYRLEWDGWEK